MTQNERRVDAPALAPFATIALFAALTIPSSFLVAGCAANVTDPTAAAPAADGTPATTATTEERSLRAVPVVVETVNTAKDCSPLSCCFPQKGGGWMKDDPFEDGLRRLGCDEPFPYTEIAGTTNWWFFTECRPSAGLTALVEKYEGTPYDAQFITSACLRRHAREEGEGETAFIKFDPTCETCIGNGIQ
jgi:hypothetical protein